MAVAGIPLFSIPHGIADTFTTTRRSEDCVRCCGKSRPMASNDSAEGRRVKLVVSGEVMCTKIVTLSLGVASRRKGSSYPSHPSDSSSTIDQ
jgi:hypothetical protein